jgi:hypothetical protein
VWLDHCTDKTRPGIIVEAWDAGVTLRESGPLAKIKCKKRNWLGYCQCSTFVDNTQVGGAVSQQRLIIIYYNATREYASDIGGQIWRLTANRRPRPMSNLLRPVGLVPKKAYTQEETPADTPA